MSLRCYRCGESLQDLSPPLARLDICPACSVELHVCRMCAYFLATAPDACTEDDAEPVVEKTRSNFCEYFSPSADAFDGALLAGEQRARDELASLFSNVTSSASGTAADKAPTVSGDIEQEELEQANALFKD